jgi:predicted RNase H-like nuclease (RuvC/YqgF family)
MNDILQIRELIFGENIKQYEERFKELEHTINGLKNDLKEKEKALHSLQARADRLQQAIDDAKSHALESNQNEVQRLKEEIDKRLEAFDQLKLNRQDFGSYLTELGSKIKENKAI